MTGEATTEHASHVLFISTDEQTFDAMGCYGNSLVRTPNLDALARRGVRFTNHIASCPICTPARVTWLNGQYPRTHGAWTVAVPPDPSNPTMPGHLAERGYSTCLIGKAHFTSELSGEEQRVASDTLYYGFTEHHMSGDAQYGEYLDWVRANHPEHYAEVRRVTHEDPRARDAPVPDRGPTKLDALYPADLPVEVTQTRWIANRTIDYLRQRAADGVPWMAWCSFVQPHHPWNPPRCYYEQYDPSVMPIPSAEDGAHGGPTGDYNDGRQLDDAELQRMQAAYYAMVTHIDDEVGRILDVLEQTGQRERTLIVFTSDHGDYNGQRRMIRKNAGFYESILRVPLIVAGPGVDRGRVCDATTQHEDLPPTMLRMLGFDPPQWMQGEPIALSEANGAGDEPRKAAFIDHVDVIGIREPRWKLLYYRRSGQWVLTDLHNDPCEDHNLAGNPAYETQRARLESRLLQWLADTPFYRPPKVHPW